MTQDTCRFVYLDHNATTPMDPRVVDAMLPYLRDQFGNPSSHHLLGAKAANAVLEARERVAALVHAAPPEIIFTSGATESIGTVLRATTVDSGKPPGHLAVGATEHPAVLKTAHYLESRGCTVDYVSVDCDGRLRTNELEKSIANGAKVASIMAANNETGVISPLADVRSICEAYGALFHCDVTQAIGKLSFSVDDAGVDFASMSAHKIYGPKGVGALFIRRSRRDDFSPLLYGGEQEHGFRGGTPNVPGIVGFGMAAALAAVEVASEKNRLAELRGQLLTALQRLPVRVSVNGYAAERLPGTLNVRFEGVDAEALLARLPDVALSTGSACASGLPGPSPVLLAMGQDEESASNNVRFSLGRFTTADDIHYAVGRISAEVADLMALSI